MSLQRVELTRALPKPKRDIRARHDSKTLEVINEAKRFGQMYFDGPRSYGYGGYYYDGRWIPVVRDIIHHYNLAAGMRVLDIGCAKGFLVKDFMQVCPGLEAFGLDISEYALKNCEREVIGRLHLGTAESLPFPDKSFDLVLSINTLHNLEEEGIIKALKEITRVSKGAAFIQVDSYETPEEKELFEEWVLTAKYHNYPDVWLDLFNKAGYTGDFDWTIIKAAI